MLEKCHYLFGQACESRLVTTLRITSTPTTTTTTPPLLRSRLTSRPVLISSPTGSTPQACGTQIALTTAVAPAVVEVAAPQVEEEEVPCQMQSI